MSKAATKALIDEKITGNGVQAITGPILNNVLNTMVDDYGTQDEISQLGQEMADLYGEYVNNLEYVRAYTDADGRFLWGIKTDGSIEWAKGIPTPVAEKFREMASEKVDKVTGKGLSTNDYTNAEKILVNIDSLVNNPEYLRVITDSEGKMLAFREPNGKLVEKTGIKTPAIETDEIAVNNIVRVGLPKQTEKDYVYLERPKFGELRFYGILPTDVSDARTPTTLDFLFKVDDEVKLSAKCTLAIQGHGTTNYAKKGYTFEPLNVNGDAMEIKFGNMIATDSFHLKAYATDQTQTRDIGGYRIWERLIKSLDTPYNKVNNTPFAFSLDYNKNLDETQDAQFHPDGFPCVAYLNDSFLGLYTIRLKKTRQNYAMEKSQKSMIFLDASNYNYTEGGVTYRTSNLSIPFDHRGWELKNPKLKNYEDGGEIPDAGVLANIERLFNFTSNLASRYADYADYIVLPHWLVYIITEELLFSEDSVYNNINLLTWDATHWSILPYDLDLTYGLHAWTKTLYGPSQMQGIMLSGDIFPTFKSLFQTELKAMYTKMRNDGVITEDALMSIYKEQIAAIPRDIYAKDIEKWGNIWENGYTSIEHINACVVARIAYLDSIWLNN